MTISEGHTRIESQPRARRAMQEDSRLAAESAVTHSWTGGQYSVFRALFGAYLFVHFIRLMPLGATTLSSIGMLAIGTAASIALLIGWRDRLAALLLWLVWAGLFIRDPLVSDPGPLFIGLLLLLHAALSRRPFGSWDARGRLDPDSGWRIPVVLSATGWTAMILGTSYGGATQLVGSSWIHWSALIAASFFASLALLPRTRRWSWLFMFVFSLGLTSLVDFADLGAGMFLLLFFIFDPGWIAARLPSRQQGHTLVFYDGGCGLCHRTIRFLLAEDAAGLRFRYAPLDSDKFRSAAAEFESGLRRGESIPDSLFVQRPGEAMLTRAAGVLEIGHQLGGLWRVLAIVVGCFPQTLLNTGYDFIARIRSRLFRRPDDVCPILPAHLRDRFIL